MPVKLKNQQGDQIMLYRQLILGLAAVLIVISNVFADGVMEEVVVTAQKKEENIQEVPISITKMTGDRVTARFAGGEDALALAQAIADIF